MTKEEFKTFLYIKQHTCVDIFETNEDFDEFFREMEEGIYDDKDVEKFEMHGWVYYEFDVDEEITEITPICPESDEPVELPAPIVYYWDEVEPEMFDKWANYIQQYTK